jgi:hypothetical protein
MQQRQHELLDEAAQARLARQRTVRHRIQHLLAATLGRIRQLLVSLACRTQKLPEREFSAESVEGAESPLG